MEGDLNTATDGDNESVHSEDDGEDPCRIQIELDILNSASDSINKLETELEKARNKFMKTKTEARNQLNQLLKKIGRRAVRASQPYYKLTKQLHKAQVEAQKAAAKYQDAYSTYVLAKEEVRDAELQLAMEDTTKTSLIDSPRQEILNKATIGLYDAEKEKIACEQEHHTKTSLCAEHQQQIAQLLKENSHAIQKAKTFYDLKDVLEMKLKTEKQNAEDLQLALVCNKQKYKLALDTLEHMSEEVHARRKSRQGLPPRTPGVGAEAESIFSDLPSENISQSSVEFCEEKELNSCTSSMHDLCSYVVKEPNISRVFSLSRKLRKDAHPEENLCREDLLEGAENLHDTIASELAASHPLIASQVFGQVQNTSSEVEVPDVPFGTIKVSDFSRATAQANKRSVVVRDLRKGIYVTSCVSSGNANGLKARATAEEKIATGCMSLEISLEKYPKEEKQGKKKKVPTATLR